MKSISDDIVEKLNKHFDNEEKQIKMINGIKSTLDDVSHRLTMVENNTKGFTPFLGPRVDVLEKKVSILESKG